MLHVSRCHCLRLVAWVVFFAAPPSGVTQTSNLSQHRPHADAPYILSPQERRVVVPLIPFKTLTNLINEISGELALQHVEELTRYDRVQPSRGHRQAAEYILQKAKQYNLQEPLMETLPADGKISYSTFKTRPAWDVEFAELWLLKPEEERLASYAETAVSVATYSRSTNVTGELVDVGSGMDDADYVGKAVQGKIVLANGAANSIHRKAVYEHGALGAIVYRLNLIPSTGFEDLLDLVTQGTISPRDFDFPERATFVFMISPRKGRQLHTRLRLGEQLVVRAQIHATVAPGEYEWVTATIPGAEKGDEEFVLSCHLCHRRPGANDNASGCAVILEIGRSLVRLIERGILAPPRRTIRFIWPPENSGTVMYHVVHPGAKARQIGAAQFDGVGGNPKLTNSTLHLYRTPFSLPSYLNDVAQNFLEFVADTNREKIPYRASYPYHFQPSITSPGGTRDPFAISVDEFFDGSDSFIYNDSSIRVPAVYLEDWPDPYLHTSGDRPENQDSTKLKRVAVVGAAIAYAVASSSDTEAIRFGAETFHRGRERLSKIERNWFAKLFQCDINQLLGCYAQARNAVQQGYKREGLAIVSPLRLADNTAKVQRILEGLRKELLEMEVKSLERLKTHYRWIADSRRVPAVEPELTSEERAASLWFPQRSKDLIGPMDSFFFDYLTLKFEPSYRQRFAIFNLPVNAYAFETAYEALNFADGNRSVLEITRALQAEFGDVPLDAVEQYLRALANIGVVDWQERTPNE